jgi:hypothetical protein
MLALALFAAAAALDGHWTSQCLAMGENGRHGTVFRLTIAHGRAEMIGQTYAHAACDTPTIETRLTGKLHRMSWQDDRFGATLTIGDVTMKPESADVVAIWNRDPRRDWCATRQWRLDEAQSVAGGACVAGRRFPDRGARLIVHASKEGDTLRLPYPLPGGNGAPILLTRDQ